jgi:glutamate-1-semialdehyde 2,1-aminomutase
MFIKEEIRNFQNNHPKSEKIWEKAIKVLPGGISHNIRNFGLPLIGAFPIFINSAEGPYLTDIDNNKYLDFWNGHFAMILGHNHPIIREEIESKLKNGWHFGTNTEYQVKLAEIIVNDNPSIEKIRFCTSGTEATMYALRLARAFTKKKLVAKAKYGWHGANDSLCYYIPSLYNLETCPGLPSMSEAGIMNFEINNEKIFDLIKNNSRKLAAVILELVMGGGGGFSVEIEFLKKLREETEKYDILLIFDEVITGYRFLPSLFQNEIKILADLTTMGKIIGGGMPIGALGGRNEIIDLSNPETENRVLIGGGTFSGYPLSMIAGLKTLEILKSSQQEYIRINKEGEQLLNNLNKMFNEEHTPIIAKGYKSMVMLHCMKKWIENPSIEQIYELKDNKREALLQLSLFNRNISGLHGLGSISMTHTRNHIVKIQEIIKEIAKPIAIQKFD